MRRLERWMRQHRVLGSGPLGCNVTACGSDHAGRLLDARAFFVAGFRSGTVYSSSSDSISQSRLRDWYSHYADTPWTHPWGLLCGFPAAEGLLRV